MNCIQTQELIHAYRDQELDAANSLALEKHIQGCQVCRNQLTQLNTLCATLQSHLTYHRAPSALRHAIEANLASGTARPESGRRKTLITALAVSFLILLTTGIVFYRAHLHETVLINEILAGHMRALNSQHLTEINSKNTQILEPWLSRKLKFSPRIFNLANEGFSLQGARLDYLQDQLVASLVYRHHNHIIDLYTWPSPDIADAKQELHNKDGYRIVYWCQNHMNYWVISDLDSTELKKFAALLRHANSR